MSNRLFADVSNNNSQTIDWGKYHDQGGHILVGLKATEGEGFIDSTHASRSAGAHRAGVWVAHYHFGHPGKSASAQAEFFWGQVKPHWAGKDFAVLDIEVSDGCSNQTIAAWVRQFTAAFKQASGHSLVGYSGESFLSGIGASGIRRWWVAKYGPPPVRAPGGAVVWAWQMNDGSFGPGPKACAGIGRCDVSELNRWSYLRLRTSRPR